MESKITQVEMFGNELVLGSSKSLTVAGSEGKLLAITLSRYDTIGHMIHIWDYDENELKGTESGRILILERMINYGPGKGKKIKLAEVKKYWDKLNLFPRQKRLFELLIWNKRKLSSLPNKGSFWMK